MRVDPFYGATPSRRPVRAPSFPPGSRFEEVAFLGQGGMGQVFKAFDPKLRRTVAIKLALGDHPEILERFTREAQAQARVDHPFVAKVFEVGEIDGRP
ncbi:MAG TPA: hypothetical protein VJ483_01250, partial [Holophagaceae bacterium]|nr:hypothetical protein [Holophagaceae bacterium]